MRLLIAGDLSIQDRARKKWQEEDFSYTFKEIRHISDACDHAIVNLESPITCSTVKILKDGPSLKNDAVAIDIIKYCGFDIVTLANNHLKDYGSKGVIDTLNVCNRNSITTIGAGLNTSDSRKPLIINNKREVVVGVLNVCEHESSIATVSNAGAAPLDLANLFYDIKALSSEVDKVMVIIHGGCEHYQLPTPRMKKEYHLLCDYGADIIVNHHQHCYSGYEFYNGKPIFYGLGNFYFDNPHKRKDKWNEGLLLQLEINKDEIDFELIPYRQCDDEPVIEIRKYEEIKESIEHLNEIIADDALLNKHFDELVASQKPLYAFLPYGNHYLRALYNRNFLPDCMSAQRKAYMENAISCETHREILLSWFEKNIHNG